MKNNKGFTLIEIIVVIVLGGIVAAMLAPFLGSSLTKSHEPLDNIGKAVSVSSDMAMLVADFGGIGSVNCAQLKADIEDFNFPHESDIDTLKIYCFDDSKQLTEDPGDCALFPVSFVQVTLKQKDNFGETLTFLFPCI
jgi:prepilin-type N-terminal cleavage/methylation domain-containing protein